MNEVITVLQLIGVASFAVSGAMTAIRKQFDVFGVMILAIVTALGGGLIRDIIINIVPPFCFAQPMYLYVSAITGLLFFLPFVRRPLMKKRALFDQVMFWTDTVGLGLFAVSGVQTAQGVDASFHPALLLFVGMLTGTGGGILRDMMVCEVPGIFIKHVYALAALGGSAVYLALDALGLPNLAATLIGAAFTIALRFFAAKYRWNMPRAKE